jgi:hypothetical protein
MRDGVRIIRGWSSKGIEGNGGGVMVGYDDGVGDGVRVVEGVGEGEIASTPVERGKEKKIYIIK